ncbi:MAG: hypothetical protein GY806_21440 [Gammaproteobacteria bacterium]|nr:hypothetical protein [Gammaproteobacteria bacterium]
MDARIFDAGAGTGLVGQALSEVGFQQLIASNLFSSSTTNALDFTRASASAVKRWNRIITKATIGINRQPVDFEYVRFN